MGGSIGVESAASGGARFYLQLSLPTVRPPPVEPESPPEPTAGGGIANQRALVVEDQPYNQLVARTVLERLGYTVEVSGDGADARRCLDSTDYALVLLDWDVPGAKGDELARHLRARPAGPSAAVFAVTAHDSEEIRRRCLDAGMDGFFVKPLEEISLRQALQKLHAPRPAPTGIVAGASDGGFEIFDYLGRGDAVRSRLAAEEYRAQLAHELAGLENALAAADLRAIAANAHRLRAHAAVVQCHPLNAAARVLQEKAAGDGDWRGAAGGVRHAAEQLRAALDALLKTTEADGGGT